MHRTPLAVLGFVMLLSTARAALGQCSNQWLPGLGVPGTNADVVASTMWDPDGNGPQPPVLVVGGAFIGAGSMVVNYIAVRDLVTDQWSALGTGMDGPVTSLAVLPNGDLVAGGAFSIAGGVPANKIARWNGSTWSALGSGLNNGAASLAVLPNGDLVAGGYHIIAGGLAANNIARWDGFTWSALGSGLSEVSSLGVLPNGDLVAGCPTYTGANYIARWNGSTWSTLGTALSGYVYALAVLGNGDLVVGGNFNNAGGVAANSIARWNGSTWSALGTGSNSGAVWSLAVLPNGDLAMGGEFNSAGGVAANHIARWNGSTWSALGTGTSSDSTLPNVKSITVLPNGDLIAGGRFSTAGGVAADCIARWNGTAWSSFGTTGMNDSVTSVAELPNGDLVAGGWFTTVGGVAANYIARWSGSTWSALGTGMNSRVVCVALLPNGDLVAGGSFTIAGGVAANNIARWNGSTWSAFGTGMSGDGVSCLAVLPNGDLVAGGTFNTAGGLAANNIARWNGSTWSALGTGTSGGSVTSLAVLPNGDLAVGGTFSGAGGVATSAIARWNGSTWSALGTGMNNVVHALAVLPNGDLVVGGQNITTGGLAPTNIARWNGSTWSALGTGFGGSVFSRSVDSLAVLPNGDLVAGGTFSTAGGLAVSNIARWNGSMWSALGTGLDPSELDYLVKVRALTVLSNGDLVAGGRFFTAGGNVSACFARLTTSCPANTIAYGNGCSGSAGPVSLSADTQPWLGSTFRTTATGIGPNAFAVSLIGLSQVSAPLSVAHPAALPGCTLLVNPDVQIDFLFFPVAGAVHPALFLPNDPSLAGVSGYMQVAQVELDPQLTITQISSSNGLSLTVGSF